jgi:hypothetical protein
MRAFPYLTRDAWWRLCILPLAGVMSVTNGRT